MSTIASNNTTTPIWVSPIGSSTAATTTTTIGSTGHVYSYFDKPDSKLKVCSDLFLLVRKSPGLWESFEIKSFCSECVEVLVNNKICQIINPSSFFGVKEKHIVFADGNIIKEAEKKGIKIQKYFPRNLLTADEETIGEIIE